MKIKKLISLVKRSFRPSLLVGSGIKISNTEKDLLKFSIKNNIPVVTAWAHDAYPNYHRLYFGRQGTIGNRCGNFVIQNSDLVIILGSRLSIRQLSYNWKSFAIKAKIVWVEIDKTELEKKFIKPYLKINLDLKFFFKSMLKKKINTIYSEERKKWIKWCNIVKKKYSPKYSDYKIYQKKINVYHFVISLFNLLKKKEIIVCADGAATVVPNQVGYLNKGCKLIYNSGSASMGYELPAAIGAAIASPKRKIICLAGDGSIMMNLQELQSIVALKLNIVIFLINNSGYLSIKQTQNNFFKSEFGSSSKSGLTFPDFIKVAKSFNFNSYNLNKPANLKKKIEDILKKEGPMFINVDVDQIQEFEPRLKSKIIKNKIVTPDLDDMYPFLDPSEINFLKKQL